MPEGEARRVKGVILQRSWTLIRELLDQGRLDRDVLEARLEPEDLALLDGKPEPSLWYSVGTASRFSDVVAEVTGEDGPEAWTERGREAMEDVLRAPTFANYVEEALKASSTQAMTTLVGMFQLLLDFGEMAFEGDLERYEITLSDVPDLPDLIRYAIQGGIERLSQHVLQKPVRVESCVVDPSTIRYSRA